MIYVKYKLAINMVNTTLRYPGGKSRAVKHIIKFFPENRTCVSPFIGGGSIEIELAKTRRVYGYDIFLPLVCYWTNLLSKPHELANQIQSLHPITKTKFLEYRQSLLTDDNTITTASKYFVINRSSFSGTTLSGGFSKEAGQKRFTKSSIERVRMFKCPNLSVEQLDFSESIPKHPNDILYLDPPYYTAKRLYGNKGELQNINHELLHTLLSDRDDWILSYDNCEYIRDLYSDYYIVEPEWSYGMSKTKKSKELLILSSTMEEYAKTQGLI